MISAAVRRTVRTLYAFACGYCGISESEVGAYLTIDHYQPQEAGGADDLDNLVYACHACNLHKSTAWNPQNPSVLHPLRVGMAQHIRILSDDTLQGLTPEGIRHIEILHLNRPPMVARRRRLRLFEMLLEQQAQRVSQESHMEQEIRRKNRTIRRRGPRQR